MTEVQIEAKMVRMIRDRGGLCYKFVSPSNPGVPDRIVITPDGRTIYIELKTEIGRLAKIQQWQLEEMRKRNADVRVLKGMEQVDQFLREVMPK
jgi:VRR-NUC domain.